MCNAMLDAKIIAHVTGEPMQFQISQQLFRFVDDSWFNENGKKFKDMTAETTSWHTLTNQFGNHDQLEGEDLAIILKDKSDFVQKHGGDQKDLPAMMFDNHNCDLYDNVRPIQWRDPVDVSVFHIIICRQLMTLLLLEVGLVGWSLQRVRLGLGLRQL